jgi:predicted transcriptional regulator
MGTEISNIAVFERILLILHVINKTPIATIEEVGLQALPELSSRSAQRYIKNLEQAGYIKTVGNMPKRIFLTEKTKAIFRVENEII